MKRNFKSSVSGWSRRRFLTNVGKAGGSLALYETMVALNMIPLPDEWDGMPELPKDSGVGKSVLILGAGIGGLTTAYLLSKYGYRVEILEATSRAGGRNHTARKGDSIVEESAEHGTTYQECKFDSGLYLNLGPGRLPYHHRRVLGYCQELNVKLEPYIMNSTGNLFYSKNGFEGSPKEYKKIKNDTRGYIAELLAKAVNKGALDEELNEEDKSKLLKLVQHFGELEVEKKRGKDVYSYNGTTRDGCGKDVFGAETPNVHYNCDNPETFTLEALLDSNFWESGFYNPMEFEWQPTLFQPVGGMDQIVKGFLRAVGNLVTYNAPVTNVQVDDNGVTVTYMDGASEMTKRADYCVSNIPCSILKNIENNFESTFKTAVERTLFASSCKVGWQTNTRFWESDKYQIYGGISWTDEIIEQIWYPSNDYFSQKGTLTGAYIHDLECGTGNASKFGKMSLQERLQAAKKSGSKLHDEINDEDIVPTELGLSIAWQNVPNAKGAWAEWGCEPEDEEDYNRLLLPDRRFYIVGDQVSTLPGWQEGAMMSAEHVVELIAELKEAVVPEGVKPPNSFEVTTR